MNPVIRPNLLITEKSPYLLQHSKNPVHWMPWGEAAFEAARRQNKPIFLSIGYSTCHWCHVMAHESFEDQATADILNEKFVCIKVDREERPDVDRLYMNFVQATTGSGGWPMSVWLTPDLRPFFGGTYFPPVDRVGRPGFPRLLNRIAEAWKEDRERIVSSAAETIAALQSSALAAASDMSLSTEPLKAAFATLVGQYDQENGGFGSAPKFPRPATLNFLLQYASLRGVDDPDGRLAGGMALQTLKQMSLGGIHDHLGGGFHRYSVDRVWHVPHYEKMLYDQAQLVCAHLEAHQLTGDALCASTAASTLDYVLREMTDPLGGFHSAEDADSLFELGKPGHGEGAFYVWTKAEIDALLGVDAGLFNAVYGVHTEGNSPKGSDPHGELSGKNTLIRKLTPSQAAEFSGESSAVAEAVLARCRSILLEKRSGRPRPHRDDKILTAWNGLMISALARGSAVLDQPRYLAAAQKAARFIQQNLRSHGTLLRTYRQGAGAIPGFAEDYAFLIQGLLDLAEADFNPEWVEWALELQKTQDKLFLDAGSGGYFSSAEGDASVLVRIKEDHDGAEPSASSVSVRNLLRLSEWTGQKNFREEAEKAVKAFGGILQKAPTALPQMLHSLGALLEPCTQVVIAGDLDQADTQALLKMARLQYSPNRILLHADSISGAGKAGAPSVLGENGARIAQMRPVDGRAAAYVCKAFACRAPVTSPEELGKLLKQR